MFSRNRKQLFILGASVTLLVIGITLISAFWPSYETRFLELGILGKDKRAAEYYPNDDYHLSIDSQVIWYIYLHNHMGSPQDVNVRVKLLNSTMVVPDDQENLPSSQNFFIEFPSSLSVNETVLLPFSWSISEASQENSTSLQKIMVENEFFEVDVSDSSNMFRMVFELWVYDAELQDYRFGWESEKGFSSTSLHIGFSTILN